MTRRTLLFAFVLALLRPAPAQVLEPLFPIVGPDKAATVVGAAVDWQGNTIVSGYDTPPSNLWTTDDGGQNWKPGSGFVEFADPISSFSLVVDPEDPMTIYTCSYNGIRRSGDGGRTSYRVRGGNCHSLVSDPSNHKVLLSVLHPEGLIRSTDFGNTWTSIPLSGFSTLFVSGLAQDSSGFGMAALFQGQVLWTSADHGAEWRKSSLPSEILALSYHPHRYGVIYAVTADALYRSDADLNWFLLAKPTASIRSIYADPQHPGRVWTVGYGGVFRSDDEGKTWTLAASGSYRALAGCGSVMAIGDKTIWTTDGGQHWLSIDHALDTVSFGAGCRGYGRIKLNQTPLFRKFSPTGQILWDLSLGESLGDLKPMPPPRNGFAHIFHQTVQQFDGNGKLLTTLMSPLTLITDSLEFTRDGGVALSGYDFARGALRTLVRYEPDGRVQFQRPGLLLAIDPEDRVVSADAEGVGVWDRGGFSRMKLLDDPKVHALRYLSNGDFVAAGYSRTSGGDLVWLARFTPGSTTPIWRIELPVDLVSPEFLRTRLTLDNQDRIYAEIPGRESARTFALLDRDGAVLWSVVLENRKLLSLRPDGTLSVVATENGNSQIERFVPPQEKSK